ncbi:sensor histidine kinase [Streptomyces sp. NPDC006463]|uniref:sensor histidine kinase n=1 Tax=Streptomyces sp. NPDC006463 TaxID=3364746 RepID=UPI0036AC43D8
MSDTGPVIDPAGAPRLLEPFRRRAQRQHAAGEAAGLGLSITASTARAHGAELTARANPAPGGGLTVRVGFPVGNARYGRAAFSRTEDLLMYGRFNEQAPPSPLPYPHARPTP